MLGYMIAIGVMISIYGLLTLGLNLHYGYTGMINFGHVAFFAVGAYTSALLVLAGYPIALGVIAAAAAAAVLAYPLGVLCLRLRADYLAIVTLSFSEIVRIVLISEEWLTNGTRGLAGIPRPFSGLGRPDLAYFALVAGVLVVCLLVVRKLTDSPFGRLIRAVRDDEDAVRSVGKDPASLKVKVLMLGGGLAGLAGAFYAHYVTYISPDQFLPIITFYVWIAMIMGGAGTRSGAVVGAALLLVFLEGSRFLRDVVPVVSEVQMASLRLAVIGLALVLFMLYRPQGLIPDRSRP
ncbi:branched-chain amino acid ABC transporter permease [Alsobacter sp. KACC 23698]|uniref:Branched-chain amino acid ABC transporter permease n=1 Tax=Alsobacter sp. KACC 23698 TaxID=3149229 RepID=A0AAU7JJP2_9HYPH